MLLQTLRREDIKGRGDKFDFDLGFGGILGFGGPESVLYGVDSFVAKAGDFDVGADFGGLGSEAAGYVGLEFGFYDFGGECYRLPYVGISGGRKVSQSRR